MRMIAQIAALHRESQRISTSTRSCDISLFEQILSRKWGDRYMSDNSFYATVNLYILVGALVAMLLLYLAFARAQGSPAAILLAKYPSTAAAFWFFFAGYASLFFLYLWIYLYLKAGRSLNSPEFDIGSDILANVANLCFFAAAVAYFRGNQFRLLHAAGTIVLVAFLIAIWAF